MRKSTAIIVATSGVVLLVGITVVGVLVLNSKHRTATPATNVAASNGTAGLNVSDESDTMGSGPQTTAPTTDNTGTTLATASNQFSDGLYLVNSNVAPGTYKNDGSGDCSWQRLNALSGNKNVTATGKVHGTTTVTILGTDKAFKSDGCGTWRLQSSQ